MKPSPVRDAAARVVNVIHRSVFRASNGRLGGKGFGMPVVELVTIGRKSGQPRSTMLTSPVQEGDSVVLVASYGGNDTHPLWYLNLVANPDVEIALQGRRTKGRARVATPEEKAELWPRVTAAYKGYAAYQKRTERDIPLVIVERT